MRRASTRPKSSNYPRKPECQAKYGTPGGLVHGGGTDGTRKASATSTSDLYYFSSRPSPLITRCQGFGAMSSHYVTFRLLNLVHFMNILGGCAVKEILMRPN
jgi:hypothetical protein